MSHVHHYPTLTQLWHKEVERQLFAKRKGLDFVASIDTIRYDCLLSCDSMEFDFDSGRDLWLMKQRFTTLQRAYVDLYELESFLGRCKEIGLGQAKRGVVTQMFAHQHPRSDKKYRWGNCMLGWDFRGGNRYEQPTLTMHSRVSYIAYIGGLDLALCYVLAREIGERIGCVPEEFAFRWYLSSSQFHGFKSLPLLYSLNYEDLLLHEGEYPSTKYPTLRLVRKWHSGVVRDHENGLALTEQKYGPLRRIRRRYEEFKDGTRYSTPLDQLTFAPLRNQR